MRITKYGHACLLVEQGKGRFLIDPGAFSDGFQDVSGLDAIFITHQHPDHFVADNIKNLVRNNPKAVVYADEETAKEMEKADIAVTAVHAGDSFDEGGEKIDIFGQYHAIIHPDIPGITDVGYMIGEKFFYPGDAYTVPGRKVEVLAAPAAAPWLKIQEAIDYVRAIKPEYAIPVHDAVLSEQGLQLHQTLLRNMGQAGEVRIIENGKTEEFS